jgi:hypothetical protein
MAKIVEAFHKVFSDLGQALDHVDDTIYPGADGSCTAPGNLRRGSAGMQTTYQSAMYEP